jgi:hypothetical protein
MRFWSSIEMWTKRDKITVFCDVMPCGMVHTVDICDTTLLHCTTFQKTVVLKFTTENSKFHPGRNRNSKPGHKQGVKVRALNCVWNICDVASSDSNVDCYIYSALKIWWGPKLPYWRAYWTQDFFFHKGVYSRYDVLSEMFEMESIK